MIGLQINGKPAVASGSLMIPPNVIAGIPLPGGTLTLAFETTGEEGFHWDHWNLTITAEPNPLGIALDVPLPTNSAQNGIVAFTIHTVGSGPSIYRLVNYTAYVS